MSRTTIAALFTGFALSVAGYNLNRLHASVGPPKAHGFEKVAGVLTSSGASVNNTTTAAPFTLSTGATYAVQCDSAACVKAGAGSATAASCTMGNANVGVQLSALQLYDVPLSAGGSATADTISMIPVTGSGNCQLWLVVL